MSEIENHNNDYQALKLVQIVGSVNLALMVSNSLSLASPSSLVSVCRINDFHKRLILWT
jgi:hypothetical protein